MQLISPGPGVRAQLAAATVALLGAASPPARAVEGTSAALLWAEPDRVTALETRVDLRSDLAGGRVLRMNFVLDALTGASPNGAIRSRIPQTFTRASGAGSYRIAPGETPLDDEFEDTRYAGGVSLEQPLGRLTRATLGANASTEGDYLSLGASAGVARDLFHRNTTVSAAVSGSLDTVKPFGGTPVPFDPMPSPTGGSGGDGDDDDDVPQGSEDKRVADLLVGVTQVVDRGTIVQLNYSLSRSTGYLTDPYKLITLALGSGLLAGDPVDYLHEGRPDERLKHALFCGGKRALGRDVLDLSYRYLWDDWGIRSHTAEARYLRELGERSAVEPQVRFYTQTAADFFRYSLIDGEPLPEHASADTRLGAFDAWTVAAKVTRKGVGAGDLYVRLGWYVQTGESHPAEAVGAQRGQDLFPTVTALLSQVGYSFRL